MITLNCSRIGLQGGLRTFAGNVMQCLAGESSPVSAVLPEGIPAPAGIHKISTPSYLASASGVSLLRPLAWFVYSYVGFPLSREARVLGVTHHVLPRCKHQIVTVHDLRPYFMPDHALQRIYFHHILPGALRRCDGVLTVSEASRQMLMEIYGLAEDRVRVVPNAITINAGKINWESTLAYRPAEPEFLLLVGASWSHKNAEEVLRMSHLWKKRFHLKIVSGEGGYRDLLIKMVHDLGLKDKVEFPPRLTPDQLQEHYRRCTALLYPSKMEGFGLPPLEAMSFGKPTIVSDISVFRELYGDWPFFVELGNEASWAAAFANLERVDGDRLAGARMHAASFSLEKMCSSLQTALRHFWG